MTTASAPALMVAALVLLTMAALRASVVASRRSIPLRRLSSQRGRDRAPMTVAISPKFAASLTERLVEVGLDIPAARLCRWWTTATPVAVAGGLLLAGPAAAVALLATAVGGPWLAWTLLRHRGDEASEAAVPLVLDELARSLRSGASLLQALQEAASSGPGRLRPELALVASGAERGQGVVPALEGWAERMPLPAVRLAVAAVCLGAELGGAQARAVDGVAATIRLRLGLAGEARALAAQARLSAAVIALAPVVFGAMAAATDERVGHILTATPLGWALLTAGLALDVVGARWMARLARISA